MARSEFSVARCAVAIIGVCLLVACLIGPRPLARGNYKIPKAKADLAMLRSAIDQFDSDCGQYPTSKEGFSALYQAPAGLKNWQGPYLQKEFPLDPWGNPYLYKPISRGGQSGYVVESYGKDGLPGGQGDDSDIIDGSQ